MGRLQWFALSLAVLCACAGPLVTRGIPDGKRGSFPQGVRYLLKRPSYELGLRIGDDNLKRKTTLKGTGPRLGYCFDSREDLALLVTQGMEGDPVLYEVRGQEGWNRLVHAFADSEWSITLDETGGLSGVTAGETDKTLETIVAIAGAAKVLLMEQGERDRVCWKDAETLEGFEKYVYRHRLLLERRDKIGLRIDEMLAGIPEARPDGAVWRMQAVERLRGELVALEAQIKAVQYKVPKEHYKLQVGGVCLNNGKGPIWFEVKLRAKGEEDSKEACA